MRRYNEQKSPLYRHFLKLPYTHLTEEGAQKTQTPIVVTQT